MNGTHIAAITETLLTGNEDVQISGYQWLGQNREPNRGNEHPTMQAPPWRANG